MNKNSLMLGNFLWDTEKNELYVISELPIKKEVEDHLTYIEITGETLIKYLGFEKDEWYSERMIDTYKLDLSKYHISISYREYSNHPLKDWYLHIDNEDFETVGGMDVKYIHEIQNMLNMIQDE